MTLKCLKKKAGELKLPVLERKWSKIDQDFVSRREQAIKNRIAVVDLKQQGFRNVEIAKQLGLSQAAISVILKKSQRRTIMRNGGSGVSARRIFFTADTH
jgi:DNA-binding NarL/FixJ family response regulator